MLSRLPLLSFWFLVHSGCASFADCSDAASTAMANALRPVVEKTQLCSGLKTKVKTPLGKVRIVVDKTEAVELTSLRYCPSDPASTVQATVHVACATPDKAAVQVSVEESFDIRVIVRKPGCQVSDIHIEPRGEVGKLIARHTDLLDKAKAAIAEHIADLCH
jgi:hypothetical protein